MAIICPTITAFSESEYKRQLESAQGFAKRVHIDLTDGEFAPSSTVEPKDIWWPSSLTADVHLMHHNPETKLEPLLNLKPDLVIIHAEADGNLNQAIASLKTANIRAGLALLADTTVAFAEKLIAQVDHVLIFSGNLGYQGGSKAHLELLAKADLIKAIKPDAELAWDGGVNDQNIVEIAQAGIEVINVGGYIQKADSPRDAYAILEARENSL